MASWSRESGWKRESCSAVPIGRSAAQRSFLTRDEEAEYQQLAAWFLRWGPPAEPYSLAISVEVIEPGRSHVYVCEHIREGCGGQVQRAVLCHLRWHWKLFGEKEGRQQ